MNSFVAKFSPSYIIGAYTSGPFVSLPSAFWIATGAGVVSPSTFLDVAFDLSDPGISLNGASDIRFASLPAGFHLLSFTTIKDQSGFAYIAQGSNFGDSNVIASIQYGSRGPQITNWQSNGYTGFGWYPAPVPYLGPQPKILDLITFIEVKVNLIPGATNAADFGISQNIELAGTYDIISTSWQLENLTFPNTNTPLIIRPGDLVKISTPDNSYDFTTIDKVYFNTFNFVFSGSFITWTPLEITFQVPYIDALSPTSSTIISIEGTQFSGSAVLASALILLADSSGIYSIIDGKTSDTLYVGNGSSLTEDNKIPDPFAKTGFIGG
jgi:hypothetical protein